MKQSKLGDTAEKNLQEKAEELIADKIDLTQPSPTLIWWDRKGFLEPVVEEAAENMDIDFVQAEKSPLELRKNGFSGKPEVWYVPQAKEGREWFEDVNSIGGEMEYAVHELAAELYDDLIAVELCEPGNFNRLDEIGELLVTELTGSSLPTSDRLFSKVYTQEGDLIEYILKVGWEGVEDDERKQKIVEALSGDIGTVSSSDDPQSALEKTRKWFVAKWLVESGLDKKELPEDYRKVDQLKVKNKLKLLLETNPELDSYVQDFWPELMDNINVWDLVECPVEGSLEKKLWRSWKDLISEEEFEEAQKRASDRYKYLKNYYGKTSDLVLVWEISESIACLADHIESWEDVSGEDIFEKYSEDDGLWRIDRAARKLQSLNNPSLRIDHPAENILPEIRQKWMAQYYNDYLSDLADYTEKDLSNGSLFGDHQHAFQFWEDKEEELQREGSKAIFYIDALRFDLAKELAERLNELEEFEVEEESRIGCLPSATKFGMNTLIPGSSRSFSLKLEDKLTPYKNRTKIHSTKRKEELRQNGWHEATSYNGDWNHPKTFIFDQELDEYGEESLDDIENKIDRRLETIKEQIKQKLETGGYDKAFIVTDHGFMLMPEDYKAEKISPSDNAVDVNRRWCAGNDLEPKNGVELDKDDLNYLQSPITLLVNPHQRYRNQGVSDKRYFHGGGMPQEFILNFIKLEEK
jgi:hypothetical protein